MRTCHSVVSAISDEGTYLRPQAHEEVRQFIEVGGVVAQEEGQALDRPAGRYVEAEVLGEHLASGHQQTKYFLWE